MKLPKKRRCVVAVQQPRRNQKRRGANVDGGGGEIIFSISFEISSVAIRKSWEVFPYLSGYSNSKEEEMSTSAAASTGPEGAGSEDRFSLRYSVLIRDNWSTFS